MHKENLESGDHIRFSGMSVLILLYRRCSCWSWARCSGIGYCVTPPISKSAQMICLKIRRAVRFREMCIIATALAVTIRNL